jgi:hypothetical protein
MPKDYQEELKKMRGRVLGRLEALHPKYYVDDITWEHDRKGTMEMIIEWLELDGLSRELQGVEKVEKGLKDRQKGWLGKEEDGSDRHEYYDELQALLTHIATIRKDVTNKDI